MKINDAWILPYQIAAEEEAEDEDKDGRPKHHNVDVKGKVLEPYVWHPETVVREIWAHGYSEWKKKQQQQIKYIKNMHIHSVHSQTSSLIN